MKIYLYESRFFKITFLSSISELCIYSSIESDILNLPFLRLKSETPSRSAKAISFASSLFLMFENNSNIILFSSRRSSFIPVGEQSPFFKLPLIASILLFILSIEPITPFRDSTRSISSFPLDLDWKIISVFTMSATLCESETRCLILSLKLL